MNRKRYSDKTTVASLVALVVLVLIGWSWFGASAAPQDDARTPTPTASLTTQASTTSLEPTTPSDEHTPTAADVLALLPAKGRAPKTDYSRDQFGPRWSDVDRNGCDQRNDVLNRDLTNITHKDGTRGCVVVTGTLESDPFTGTRIDFVRGEKTSQAVQIDHVVALSDAWQKGAQQLTEEQRLFFANDPLNLLAVDGPTNHSKSDGDAASWLPPHKAFRCTYVATQVAVKHKYDLWVTQAEHDAIARVLESCPDEPLPQTSGLDVPSVEPG